MKKKKLSHKWFIAVRGSYLPVRWEGWLLHAAFASYLVLSAIIVVKNNTSMVLATIEILAQWVTAAVVMTWIAQQKS